MEQLVGPLIVLFIEDIYIIYTRSGHRWAAHAYVFRWEQTITWKYTLFIYKRLQSKGDVIFDFDYYLYMYTNELKQRQGSIKFTVNYE